MKKRKSYVAFWAVLIVAMLSAFNALMSWVMGGDPMSRDHDLIIAGIALIILHQMES